MAQKSQTGALRQKNNENASPAAKKCRLYPDFQLQYLSMG
jgi:hypothetical protein